LRRPGCPGSRSGPAPGKDTSLGSSGKPGIQQTDGPGIAATEPTAAVPGRRDAAGRMPCLERPRPCSAITLSGRQHHRNARSASLPLGMPRTRTIGRVGTIQNRLFCRVGTGWVSRRFYSPSLLFEVHAADQHIHRSRRHPGPGPSAIRPCVPGLVHGRGRENPRTAPVGAVSLTVTSRFPPLTCHFRNPARCPRFRIRVGVLTAEGVPGWPGRSARPWWCRTA